MSHGQFSEFRCSEGLSFFPFHPRASVITREFPRTGRCAAISEAPRSLRPDYNRRRCSVPAQLPFRQDQRHENDIRPHPQRTQAKYDGGLGHAAGVALEYLGGVGRDISGSTDAKPQIGTDHRYR